MRPEGIAPLRLDIGTVDATLADVVVRSIAQYPGHHVELSVKSEGGDWAAAVAIFDSLKGHGRRVTASIQRAASAGALIVMAADYRVLSPAGHFWLHMPVGPYPQAKLDQIADTKATLMATGCRVPATTIRKWMREVTTLDARRALNVGLVDEVLGLPQPKHHVVFL